MKKVKCIRPDKVFREDYEPGKVYEVEDDLAERLLKRTTQLGGSMHHTFSADVEEKKAPAGGDKKAAKKTAKKATKKKTAKKKATKSTSK